LRIHIWFTPLLAYVVAQYVWSFSFTAVDIMVRLGGAFAGSSYVSLLVGFFVKFRNPVEIW
jgi:hypothetical protein